MAELLIYLFGGSMQITLQAEDHQDLIRQAAFYSQLPRECPICGAAIHFQYRTPQEYEYYGLSCAGTPRHETTFGQYKVTKGLFYKNGWKVAYQADDEGPPTPPAPEPKQAPRRPSVPAVEMVTKQAASIFFSDMVKSGLRPQDLQLFVTAVNPEAASDLTMLTVAELERVRAAAFASLKRPAEAGRLSAGDAISSIQEVGR